MDPFTVVVGLILIVVLIATAYLARRLQQQQSLVNKQRAAALQTAELHVAELKAAELQAAELQSAADRFDVLANNLPGTVYIFNFRTGEADFSSQAVFLGYKPDELANSEVMREKVHPDDRAVATRFWLALAAGGQAGEGGPLSGVEYRLRHKDGHWEWLASWGTTLSHQPDGLPEQVLVVARTITDRRRALDALADREHRLRLLVNQVPAVLWTTNTDLVFTSSEGLGLEALGLEPGQVVGQDLFTYFGVDDPEYEPIVAHRQALTGKSRQYQLQWEDRFYQSRAEPLLDSANQITGTVGLALDITDRLTAEQALQETRRLESLGLMAGGVAHDFNNLLVAMQGQASLAAAKLPPDSPAAGNIEKAVQAAEMAASLTRQLLAYSGRGQFQIQPVQLNRLIRDNQNLFQVGSPGQVTIQMDLTEPLPLIEADPGQMQQVIMNLILNGVEAIVQEKGQVVLRTCTTEVAARHTGLARYTGQPLTPGNYVVVEVVDNGPGLGHEVSKHLFDPFFTTKPDGRGLGLAAVLGIARGHNAGLTVDSQPGQGTTFRLYFPALPEGQTLPEGQSLPEGEVEIAAAVPDEDSAIADPVAGNQTRCVLVIDDEKVVCQAVADILEDSGLIVLTAFDGAAGIETFTNRRDEIDLVLLDLSMPGLSGEETLERLRAIDPGVTVILTSGYNQVEVTQRFTRQKVAGFLQKPYEARQLVEIIQQNLAGR